MNDIEDEEIKKYMNDVYFEDCIAGLEIKMLEAFKFRCKYYPYEKNDKEWLNFSYYVIERRKKKDA